MKTRERKRDDLKALTEKLKTASSAMVVSFTKLTVPKDQEFRSKLRETGANYQVVKNTLARIAVKGTSFEDVTPHFKGVTGLAWTDGDAVVLSKTVSTFIKANSEVYTFKAGVVEGKVYDANQIEAISKLPSKEELISQFMYVVNAQAQRIATVINAVPRDLAVVVKQIADKKGE
jgi:large subunit ribosomal protein L10